MERLTVKWTDKVYDTLDPVDILDNEYSKINYNKLLTKLGEYEDLEEQGRLIKLPCKVGDTLYSALGEKVLKSEVISVKYHCEAENHGVFIRERIIIDTDDFETEINFSDIGKTVFLTKSEAEQKLKEMESK